MANKYIDYINGRVDFWKNKIGVDCDVFIVLVHEIDHTRAGIQNTTLGQLWHKKGYKKSILLVSVLVLKLPAKYLEKLIVHELLHLAHAEKKEIDIIKLTNFYLRKYDKDETKGTN